MDLCLPELSDASSSTSSASPAPATPPSEPSSNAHNIIDDEDYLEVDPEFAAALEHFDLMPEKVAQPDEQMEVCPSTLSLLELSES